MGCDIRIYLEQKVEGEWELASPSRYVKRGGVYVVERIEPYEGRNYELFSILAGVRGDLNPIKVGGGIPENWSDQTKYLSEGNHAFVTYTLREVLFLKHEQQEILDEFVNSIKNYMAIIEPWIDLDGTDKRIDNYRFCISFNS